MNELDPLNETHKKTIRECCQTVKEMYDDQVWDEDRGGYMHLDQDEFAIEVSFGASQGYPDHVFATVVVNTDDEERISAVKTFVREAMTEAGVGEVQYSQESPDHYEYRIDFN